MKTKITRILLVIIFVLSQLLISTSIFAQVPGKMSYQSVIRDNDGALIANSPVGIKIQVLQGSSEGVVVYSETHNVFTNANGLVTLEIGGGKVVSGSFDKIEWGQGIYFLKTETDPTGGTNYTIAGTSQFLSVPYAFVAGKLADEGSFGDGKGGGNGPGVPSQNWSLFGNSNSDPAVDKLGTTDYQDLVIVTNNLDRLRILANGDIKLSKSLEVGEDLTVKRNVYLNTVSGETINNGDFTVANSSSTLLTGTLTVDLATDLNSTLNVDGATDLNSTLTVDGATTINNTSSLNGQVTVNANVSGGGADYSAHPLRVEGSAQGIAVKLNAGTPNNSNNFITFFNSSGSAVGRIEGETISEATTTPEFIFEESILVAEEVEKIAGIALSFIPTCVGGVVVSCGVSGSSIAMAAADLVLATANLTAFNVFALQNLGVTYQSGSADYAEWLERSNPNEKMAAGDIVGVNAGKISKVTNDSRQFMVISTKPAILGNMPKEGEEALYEKVAFMGQVPVKVRGIVLSGDYIIPSGLNDGTGIAVSPEEIKTEQYSEIVGISWSDLIFNDGVSFVNMAIGLNGNDMANLAVQQEKKINELETKFSALEERLLTLENGTNKFTAKDETNVSNQSPKQDAPAASQSRYADLASDIPSELSDEVMNDAINYLESAFTKQGIDIKTHAGLNKLFTDKEYKAAVIEKTKERYKELYQGILEAAQK